MALVRAPVRRRTAARNCVVAGVPEGSLHPVRKPRAGAKRVLYVAIAGDVAIALAKFSVAAVSGSSAMLTEGVQLLVDTCNERLRRRGLEQSKQRQRQHQPSGGT